MDPKDKNTEAPVETTDERSPLDEAVQARAAEIADQVEERASKLADEILEQRKVVRTVPHASEPQDEPAEASRTEPLVAAPRFGASHQISVIKNGRGDRGAAASMLYRMGIYSAERAFSEGVDADGGHLVPDEFVTDVLMKEGELSPLATTQFSTIYPMSRDVQKFPILATRQATSRTAREEGQAATAGTRAKFGQVTLTARAFGDDFPISKELLADSPVALYELLVRLIGEGQAELKTDLYLNGNGTDQPEGILVNANIEKVPFDMTDATTVANSVEALYFAQKAAYRSGAIWLVSPRGMQKLNGLRDGNGNKLLGNPRGDEPFARLLGRPVFETPQIAEDQGAGSNETSIVFGNFRYGYVQGLREGLEIETDASAGFRERQIWLRYDERLDGRVGQDEAIKVGTGLVL